MGGSRRFLARLGLVTAAAGVWRIWYVVAVADPRTPKLALSDETFYHQQARLVADGVGFVNPFGYFAPVGTPAHRVFETAVHPPAYTMFLAVPAKLGIDSVLSQRILTALLGTATVFLLGMLGRRLAGERAGIIAAVLAAAAPALWVNDAVLGLETLYCFCVVVALLCLYRFWSSPSIGPVLGMAAALAVGALTRSEGTLLFVLLALPALLLVPGVAGRDRAKYVGATALVALLVMGPWVVRNLTTFDEPTVLGTGFGWVLAYGNCDPTYHGELLGYWSDQCALKDYPPHLEESRIDLRARHRATAYIDDHLSRAPVVVAARVGRVWDVFRPTQNVHFNAFYERRGDAASWAVLIGYYLLLPFAIGGLVVMRRRRVPIFPMIAIAVSVTITVALSFGITRYRAPVDAVLPVLAAVALDALWRRREHRGGAADIPVDAGTEPAPDERLPVPAVSETS
ncbi:MAG TPA: glycosyltransferase family 39 protein [Acidimicrobiia bacterium]|nr:glycosyltransferase family 39 protein [Acidimicrobiia bacterium]